MEALVFRAAAFLTFAMIASTAAAQGRAAQAAPPADPVAALTAEVRALRAEIAETARANIRLQLLVARLQLQEQRIIYLDRQRTDIAARLGSIQQQRMQLEGAMKTFGGDDLPKDSPLAGLKNQVALAQAQEQELQARENELLNSLAGEQARWTDLSTRLEELERSLAR